MKRLSALFCILIAFMSGTAAFAIPFNNLEQEQDYWELEVDNWLYAMWYEDLIDDWWNIPLEPHPRTHICASSSQSYVDYVPIAEEFVGCEHRVHYNVYGCRAGNPVGEYFRSYVVSQRVSYCPTS
jgi:hypothetical protein